jgi:hypothetical protein
MLVSGCKTEQDTPSTSASAESNGSGSGSGTLLVSNKDNGANRQMNVGDTLEISLLDNASDGSIWKVDEVNSSILYEVSEEYDDYAFGPNPYSSNIGKLTLRFVAIRPGQTSLLMACREPEDGPAGNPVNTFQLNVVVNE